MTTESEVSAAAVSILFMNVGNGDDLIVNRPFVYFIRDNDSKVILFMCLYLLIQED